MVVFTNDLGLTYENNNEKQCAFFFADDQFLKKINK